MKLNAWMREHKNLKEALADALGTSVGVLYQYAGDHVRMGPVRARKMEDATAELTPDAVVTRAESRPDLFA